MRRLYLLLSSLLVWWRYLTKQLSMCSRIPLFFARRWKGKLRSLSKNWPCTILLLIRAVLCMIHTPPNSNTWCKSKLTSSLRAKRKTLMKLIPSGKSKSCLLKWETFIESSRWTLNKSWRARESHLIVMDHQVATMILREEKLFWWRMAWVTLRKLENSV